ncbi:MAG: ATP-binding protein [Rhodospirillaceae bacterium]|nr:ATP-binding protein [Rhodospirillaceae bacterium]
MLLATKECLGQLGEKPMPSIDKVNIRPGVSVLSVLRHVEYEPWYALAEFVDNAIQSHMTNKERLSESGDDEVLEVDISYDRDANRLTIRDTAAGIAKTDYPRAFRPAEVPPDRTGLSEFGMGMKSAACWFSSHWEVETTALGEPVSRTIRFNIDHIVNDRIEELDVIEKPADQNAHYTEIRLNSLHRPLKGRTVGKIKEHLADIYRQFLRDADLRLLYDGTPLRHHTPPILKAAHFDRPDGEIVEWKKDIDFDFGDGLRVTGFAGLRDPGSTKRAGFALFRRGRVIQGSGDEHYKPDILFGGAASFKRLRLFGELHLEGFDVSHTKDGFKWDENEEPFLDELRLHLDKDPLPLLKQGENHRVNRKKGEMTAGAQAAADSTAKVMREKLPTAMEVIASQADEGSVPPSSLADVKTPVERKVEFEFKGKRWCVVVRLSEDEAHEDWLSLEADEVQSDGDLRTLTITMSLLHPFMDRFSGEKKEDIEPFLRIAAALGVAEYQAELAGIDAGMVRGHLNTILREAFASP